MLDKGLSIQLDIPKSSLLAQTDEEAFDRALEADVFELAAVAGMTARGTPPTTECYEFVADLARAAETTPPEPDRLFDASVRESLRALAGTKTGVPEGVRPSASDT